MAGKAGDTNELGDAATAAPSLDMDDEADGVGDQGALGGHAGLLRELVEAVEGRAIRSSGELLDRLEGKQVGETVTLDLYRGGERRTIALVLAPPRPDPGSGPAMPAEPSPPGRGTQAGTSFSSAVPSRCRRRRAVSSTPSRPPPRCVPPASRPFPVATA